MITILGYGVGNTGSLLNMFVKIGQRAVIATSAAALGDATALVLPGVGHFDAGMTALRSSGLEEPLREAVLGRKIPILGICLGMQMLADLSEEGIQPGLGFIPGVVKRFVFSGGSGWKVPNMGWRDLAWVKPCDLFQKPDEHPRFYFVHSYHFCCSAPEDVIALADYGGLFTAAVNRGNIWGTQFHPEKSHRYGMNLLSAFATTIVN